MKILVINSGSSSLKYQLFSMEQEIVLASGIVERIGESISLLTHKVGESKITQEEKIADHSKAIEKVMDFLTSSNTGVIGQKAEITAIGHRVVHGGEKFHESAIITEDIIGAIRAHEPLAPLHNPANLIGINACRSYFGDIPQVAVFDTAFHQTIPEKAFLYPIDYSLYKNYGVRRYGFHGTSHRYVANRASKFLNQSSQNLNLITIHLGNGSSITAVEKGKSIDTTMGMTPLEGIVMGTRSGDIDPGIIFYLARALGTNLEQIENILNKNSGLKGLSGTNDMRDLLSKRESGDKQAELTFQIYCYRIKKYIGAYAAAMGSLSAIVFTGGIGENSKEVRAGVISQMQILGMEIDSTRNEQQSNKEREIQTDSSKVKILVIPTNEELQIAQETAGLIKN
jgi:acetate kinase